jgi:hypothetical protein
MTATEFASSTDQLNKEPETTESSDTVNTSNSECLVLNDNDVTGLVQHSMTRKSTLKVV